MAKEFAKAFYNSKLWKDTRTAALRRDHYWCQECKRDIAKEVHHIIPLTPQNINNPVIAIGLSNLQSLCFECHKKKHFKIDESPIKFDNNGYPIPPMG